MKPTLVTCLSPSLLHLYEVTNAVVVIIDVFRATSTIAAALHHGAAKIIPVDSVEKCIAIGQQTGGITAGERDGKVVEGLMHGNSPLEYPAAFIQGKTLVLTTTNGTRLLQMALDKQADTIITGSFPNMGAVAHFLKAQNKNVLLGCAAWKDKINLEDTLFAGAIISHIKQHFEIRCDASLAAENLYESAKKNMWHFIKQTTHYHRLAKYGLGKDMEYCITPHVANVLPIYKNGELVV